MPRNPALACPCKLYHQLPVLPRLRLLGEMAAELGRPAARSGKKTSRLKDAISAISGMRS